MNIDPLTDVITNQLKDVQALRHVGRVESVQAGMIAITGLSETARIGHRVKVQRPDQDPLEGEVVQIRQRELLVLPDSPPDQIAKDDRAILHEPICLYPTESWLGRVIDPDGNPLDGRALAKGPNRQRLHAAPPLAHGRRPLGSRLETGLAVTNTFAPIVQGQRIGLFAGSGVGKSTLLSLLAQHMQVDVVVVGLIGERGRELRHFLDEVLGPQGLKRCVVVAATSDQSPLKRRRCAWTAMAVAEFFRDMGKSVLLLADSITRFAEAHREVAVASGEAPVLRGHPPSTPSMITALCERAGPGGSGQGDITAIFSVLVAGSDMDEPIADILRGVLDGHVLLNREIAERGRFPAVDILKSVSRSLPAAATDQENQILGNFRRLLGLYEQNALMIRAGLYSTGSDPDLDRAITLWAEVEHFLTRTQEPGVTHSFQQLELIWRRSKANPSKNGPT